MRMRIHPGVLWLIFIAARMRDNPINPSASFIARSVPAEYSDNSRIHSRYASGAYSRPHSIYVLPRASAKTESRIRNDPRNKRTHLIFFEESATFYFPGIKTYEKKRKKRKRPGLSMSLQIVRRWTSLARRRIPRGRRYICRGSSSRSRNLFPRTRSGCLQAT